MKIYTKTGDKGETALYTGQRVAKNDAFIEALGTVDECNSAIGLALSHLPKNKQLNSIKEQLEIVQHALFDLGAAVATPRTRAGNHKIDKTRFGTKATEKIEFWIDTLEQSLPTLKTFILPGGHPSSASLHLARSMCRRAERIAVPLNIHADVSDNVMTYLNRLSDYLFVIARYINHITETDETLWEHHKM